MTFENYALDPNVLDALREIGYTDPTPVQSQTIPLILDGKDMIALAETGSGKTAACAIPVCSRVDVSSSHIQALVVVPTRELALQYATETQKIGKIKKVRAFALFGGEDMQLQRAKLKDGVQILIATPGRLIDFVYSRMIDLSHVKTLILDEADQMLGMGFYEDLEFIIQCLVQDHQTLLFSATMPAQIRKIATTHMHTPKEISLISKEPTPENLSHQFTFCAVPSKKSDELIELIEQVRPGQCLIFTNSRREVEELNQRLKRKFNDVDFLHGGLEQSLRTIIMGKFTRGKIHYLIATDIAARGLDFSRVTHVFNFHLPLDQETYLHRAGRAGRSGRHGVCITLVTRRDLGKVSRLLKIIKREVEWIKSPPVSGESPAEKKHYKKRST